MIYRWKEHEKTNRMSLWSACHVAVGPPSATPFCPSDVKMWTISIINSQYKKINLTYSENYFDIEWYTVGKSMKRRIEWAYDQLVTLRLDPHQPLLFCPSDVKMWTISIINSQYKKINLTYSENYFDIEWYTVGKSMKRQIEWAYDQLVTLRLDPHQPLLFVPVTSKCDRFQ